MMPTPSYSGFLRNQARPRSSHVPRAEIHVVAMVMDPTAAARLIFIIAFAALIHALIFMADIALPYKPRSRDIYNHASHCHDEELVVSYTSKQQHLHHPEPSSSSTMRPIRISTVATTARDAAADGRQSPHRRTSRKGTAATFIHCSEDAAPPLYRNINDNIVDICLSYGAVRERVALRWQPVPAE
jgi:hypothetical protein